MSDSGKEEMCGCGAKMDRVFTVPNIAMPIPFEGYYDHALGTQVNTKYDKADAVRRIADEKQIEMVEIGNDRTKSKPKRTPYDVGGAIDALGR